MNSSIARWGRWLHWSFPLLAWPFRRRAIRQLAAHRDLPEAIPHLLSALDASDRKVAAQADAAIRSLSASAAVNEFCAAWAQGRDERLGEIVASRRYMAAKPVELRVLSGLKAGRGEELRAAGAETVAPLLAALRDKDAVIAKNAGAVLRSLTAPPAVDALIDHALTTADSAVAVEIVNACAYRHSEEGRWLLYLAAVGRFEDYHKEDFEFQQLRPEFRNAPAVLQARIRDAILKSGDIRMNALFVAEKKEKVLAELGDHDADVLVRINARNKNWDGLFRYFWVLPARHIAQAVAAMREAGWTPPDADRAALLNKLAGLCAEGVSGVECRVSSLLNPVFQQWMAAAKPGESNERAKLKDDVAPPEQLAALGALHKAGKLSAEDLRNAGRSPHWPVRMAAAALGAPLQQPNDGAAEWFKRLTLALDADAVWGLKPCQVSRDGLEALQERLGALSDKRVAGGLNLVEAVTSHYTAHDIEVEVGARVVVGEDSFEVEG